MINNKTKEEMVKKSNQPHGIKIPTTVEEFRQNLKKYYWSMGNKGLYVQQIGRPVKYDELNSLSDLYELVRKEGRGDEIHNSKPLICPLIELTKDIKEFMRETNQIFSSNGLFENEEHFEIVEEQFEHKNPKWVGIDNQIYREFFYLTLGKFSGYEYSNINNN